MRATRTRPTGGSPQNRTVHPPRTEAFLWDMLTFERLMTGPITHLIYWAGLAIIAVIGFGIAGGAIGLMLRDFSIQGVALAIPVLVVGFLVTAAMLMIWRGMCEFYLAVIRIADDLRAIRESTVAAAPPKSEPAAPPAGPATGGFDV